MISSLLEQIKKRPVFWSSLAIIVTVLISYGQTLQMYFWQDDSALIFKLQNPEGPAGSFGEGIIGSGPYKYLVTPFVPFFSLFGLNPFWYFLVGLLSYFLVVGAFWLFAKELLKDKKVAFFSTLIFSAGYIGSEIMFRIINSWQSNMGLILALLSLWAFTKYLRNRQGIRFYLFSVFFFWAAAELVFIRSHSLIFSIFVLGFLLSLVPFQIKRVPGFLIRQFPFWFIFYNFYLQGSSAGSSALGRIIKELFTGNISVFSSLFATSGYGLVQEVFQRRFLEFFPAKANIALLIIFVALGWLLLSLFQTTRKVRIATFASLAFLYLLNKYFQLQDLYWYRSREVVLAGEIGLLGSVLLSILAYSFWHKRREISLALGFGLVVLVSQIFGYYIQYPDAVFGTTHRYLNYSLIGYSLIFGGLTFALYERLQKKKWFSKRIMLGISLLPLIFIVGSNSILAFDYQRQIVTERSVPSREFYQKLKEYVPRIEKGAVFYFDVVEEGLYQKQFADFFSVGSMPESTALAIYYGVDRYDLSMITDFDELLFRISKENLSVESRYTFFYGPGGLRNTTEETRRLLVGSSMPGQLNFSKQDSSLLAQDVPTLPITHMLFSLTARVVPKTKNITYPYISGGQKDKVYTMQEKREMLSYLLARKKYYETVSVSSESEWRYQEVQNAVDDKLDSSWRGHRIWWHDNEHDRITVDLGQRNVVGKLVWVNWNHTLTPTDYTIQASLDGKDWKVVKRVSEGAERRDGEVVVEDFENLPARYVRMDITGTLSNDAPAIREIEVVDGAYDDVNITNAFAFSQNPFSFVEDQEEMEMILSRVAPLLNISVEWGTDKGIFRKELPVEEFNMARKFELVLEAGGTHLNYIKIEIPGAPVDIEPQTASIRNLSLEEIRARNLIREFSEN